MLTVLFATFDGARTLPTVLEAYRKLEVPEGGWKMVVVDNGSNDETSSILNRFKGLLPLTCLLVAEPGKNNALNAGLSTCEGDLVVLTDDDAIPAPSWLSSMRRAADHKREFDIFGGPIVARWDHLPEPWIVEWVPQGVTYTVTPKHTTEGIVSAIQVWGPNMAVRRSLFDLGYRFNPQIGPKSGTSYAMGSETEFTLRMEQLGHKSWFVQDAVVEHMVRAFQMERAWVLARAIRYGRGMYRHDRQRGQLLDQTLFGMPRWRLRRVFARALSFVGAKLTGDAKQAFHDEWTLHVDWGYLKETRMARRTHSQEPQRAAQTDFR